MKRGAKEIHQVSGEEAEPSPGLGTAKLCVSAVTFRTGQGPWAPCPESLGLQESQSYPEGREKDKK